MAAWTPLLSQPLSSNLSLRKTSLLASWDLFDIRCFSLFCSKHYSAACWALHLCSDETFHFVLHLHPTHQASLREGPSSTAQICYQVEHIGFKSQNHLWHKLRVLQKPPPSLQNAPNGTGCNSERAVPQLRPWVTL